MTDLFSFSVTYCHLVHVLHLLGIPCFEDWFRAFLIYGISYWVVCGLYWVVVILISFTLYPLFSLLYFLPALNSHLPFTFFSSLSLSLFFSLVGTTRHPSTGQSLTIIVTISAGLLLGILILMIPLMMSMILLVRHCSERRKGDETTSKEERERREWNGREGKREREYMLCNV